MQPRLQTGLHHLAFLVASRAVVREAHQWALARDAIILDEPAEFPQYGPHCFATYWLDPHGFKLEAVLPTRPKACRTSPRRSVTSRRLRPCLGSVTNFFFFLGGGGGGGGGRRSFSYKPKRRPTDMAEYAVQSNISRPPHEWLGRLLIEWIADPDGNPIQLVQDH